MSKEGSRTYLLAFHAGYRADPPDWQPSQQGMAGIYRAHLSMGGKPIAAWTISDAGVLVGGSGATLGLPALGNILGQYQLGWVAYSGQLPGSSPGMASAIPTITWIDYASGATGLAPAKGHAYALVADVKGRGQIDFYAGPAPSLSVADGTKKTGPKT